MEKLNNIIGKIKDQEIISPPDDIIQKVMVGAKRAEESFQYKLYRFLFQRRELSPDAAGILSGKIISPVQCAFLLFAAGMFYLLMGLFVLWGIKDALNNSNINFWLRSQPYLAVISGVLIMSMAFLVRQKPQMIILVKYGIIAHTVLVALNALVLEFVLILPAALAFTLGFTTLAFVAGFFLNSSMQSIIKSGSLESRRGFAQDV